MNNTDIRNQAKEYVEQLSAEKLLVAVDFLAYLLERDSNEATEELLRIPGFQETFAKAKKDIAAGKVIPVDQLKRKY
ncbi:hypothetical protein NIES2119_06545 [[Phormidium ambiguum] IAM M-71]|uniref:DUF2281 domain-containing protein n=1 Tax=[Phormidium ambiguum] IAM M-71 TaxID=454136 RepID=A0A1U7IPZ1_9CYAN|nr:hypothetical protein [Phormidium ambiguum]OKH39394.1 hypothetical protein NIES2119_06545 [Phormidium ambiguum IAM M-71]